MDDFDVTGATLALRSRPAEARPTDRARTAPLYGLARWEAMRHPELRDFAD